MKPLSQTSSLPRENAERKPVRQTDLVAGNYETVGKSSATKNQLIVHHTPSLPPTCSIRLGIESQLGNSKPHSPVKRETA